MAMAAKPPTTPPTIAPIGALLLFPTLLLCDDAVIDCVESVVLAGTLAVEVVLVVLVRFGIVARVEKEGKYVM
jgi:hypothetical protein